MNIFKRLFCGNKIKELQQLHAQLQLELLQCNEKLVEKQEHINTTNAYWKKKMRETKEVSKKSKQLPDA